MLLIEVTPFTTDREEVWRLYHTVVWPRFTRCCSITLTFGSCKTVDLISLAFYWSTTKTNGILLLTVEVRDYQGRYSQPVGVLPGA